MTHWKPLALWDGALPLVIAALPLLSKILLPRNGLAQLCVALLAPLTAAMVRTQVGSEQIKRRCQGQLPLSRQVALALAIVLVLVFEISRQRCALPATRRSPHGSRRRAIRVLHADDLACSLAYRPANSPGGYDHLARLPCSRLATTLFIAAALFLHIVGGRTGTGV